MSLYVPAKFRGGDWERVVNENPLATVLSGPMISHLPLVLEKRGEQSFLVGHLARANPHAKVLADAGGVQVIFHGVGGYISPRWYAEHDVPTWNYVVVHIAGEATLLGENETLVALRTLSSRMDPTWEFSLPDDLKNNFYRAIVGFEIRVDQVAMKAKLGQNRSLADREGAIAGLEEGSNAANLALARWMRATIEGA